MNAEHGWPHRVVSRPGVYRRDRAGARGQHLTLNAWIARLPVGVAGLIVSLLAFGYIVLWPLFVEHILQ